MNTTPITLGELFFFPSIRGITEQYARSNPGHIPVYGGRKTGVPIAYVSENLSDVKYFENCLAWNRQGSVGYVFFHQHKFTTTDDHRPMCLKEEFKSVVNLDYLQIKIQAALLSSGFAWGKTAGKDKIKDIYIDLPINDNGDFDISKQCDLADKYLPIKSAQKRLSEYRKLLISTQVKVHKAFKCKELLLSDETLFTLEIGKRVLKKDLLIDGVPAYSANVMKPFGFVAETMLDSFDRDSIIWGIDGNFEWAHIPKGMAFDITDHCGRLQVNTADILSEYFYYQLRESSSTYGFNRVFRASLQNIKSVSIDVPVKSDGSFDTHAQALLIQKYKKIDSIIQNLSKLIGNAISPQIDMQ